MSTPQPDDDGEYAPALQQASGRRGRRRRDLSFLPEVPMDIFLEILVLLEPKDLLTMSRASKDFRRALVNETMNRVVWKVKREESGAPGPPPGFSEAKWVAFLYNSFCFSCATQNVVTDFFLLKRLCVACKKANYLSEDDVNPDYVGLLDYVPMTNYSPSSSKEPAEERYCWTPDFEAAIHMWSSICDLIEDNTPGAEEALDVFNRDQFALVQWIDKTASECYGWAEARQEQRQLDKVSINERRAQIIRLNFYELGYDQVDVDEVVSPNTFEICGKTANITNRVWKNIRTKLEPEVIRTRDSRLFGITCDIFNAGAAVFFDLWDEWIVSLNLRPSESLTYSLPRELHHVPMIETFLNADADVQVTQDHFRQIVPHFPTIIADLLSQKKAELNAAVPPANISPRSPDALELATSVFRCPLYTDPEHRPYGGPALLIDWKMYAPCRVQVVFQRC